MKSEEVSELLLILTKNAKLFICVYNPGADVGDFPASLCLISFTYIFDTWSLTEPNVTDDAKLYVH